MTQYEKNHFKGLEIWGNLCLLSVFTGVCKLGARRRGSSETDFISTSAGHRGRELSVRDSRWTEKAPSHPEEVTGGRTPGLLTSPPAPGVLPPEGHSDWDAPRVPPGEDGRAAVALTVFSWTPSG